MLFSWLNKGEEDEENERKRSSLIKKEEEKKTTCSTHANTYSYSSQLHLTKIRLK